MLGHLAPALLERFMRQYYFAVDADIGSSGVENFSLADLKALLGIAQEELDSLVFRDSQTLGGSGLRQALADRFVGGDAARVMVTHGSTEANFLIMSTLLAPGDEVVVLDPLYQQLYAVAEASGAVLKRWPMRVEAGFRPDLTELEGLLTPATRMVVVNFPHNPTGVTLTRGEQAELLRQVERTGAYLVWDGAFSELTYDEPPLPEPTLVYERALSMGTLSKAYGLPGLRVGWLMASPDILEHCAHLRDYTLLHLSPLIELLAQRAIEQADVLVGLRLTAAREQRRMTDEWIARHQGALDWVPPAGGVCGFPRFAEGVDVDRFCERLAEEHRVLLVPGSCFGQPQHARLGFGCSKAELVTGLDAVSHLLGEVLGREIPALQAAPAAKA